MSEMVLIDSCMWIESLRRDGKPEVKLAINALLQEFTALTCGPVQLEVLGGARKTERKKLKALMSVIPKRRTDNSIWQKATQTAWKLRDVGLNTPWNDCIIATIALEYDYRVYSEDKHFQLMAPILGFRLYKPGYMGGYNPE